MKRFFILVALPALFSLSPAAASPDLARSWSQHAGVLYGETVNLLETDEVPADYQREVARFSVGAARLAKWVDAEGGPADFACIFRGMAEEADVQLRALKGKTRPDAPLMRLAVLFHDAEGLALAALSATERGETAPSPAGTASCSADPRAVRQYLTEQP